MVVEDFIIKGSNRYEELEAFLKTNLPEATLHCYHMYTADKNVYEVAIRYRVTNAYKLEQLHSKWSREDSKVIHKKPSRRLKLSSVFALFSF